MLGIQVTKIQEEKAIQGYLLSRHAQRHIEVVNV